MPDFKDLRIVFFGTPQFAVASLNALSEAGANIVAVVTAPDKPAGRGLQLSSTPVKEAALAKGIPVLQPLKLKDSEFLAQLSEFHTDIQVVVAFRMLPEAIWAAPPMGTINVHASLLPQYRGAAPINWAIINGESETGVTTFRLKHAIDTGDMLLQQRVPVLPADNAGTLHDKLMIAGAALLVETLGRLAQDGIEPRPQPESGMLKHAPKIFKEDTRICWTHPAKAIHDLIRGLAPHPAAFTTIRDKVVKIYAAHFELASHNASPGEPDTDGKSYLRIAASDGWIYLDSLQQEGKKRLDVAEFLRGYRA